LKEEKLGFKKKNGASSFKPLYKNSKTKTNLPLYNNKDSSLSQLSLPVTKKSK
jgi:hypothetical protein